tara:strand:+ start:168 stop:389 length:222 start_codon:yes stop_codon:yes gene_type:complete
MNSKKEGNIISFKVFINNSGLLMTEFSTVKEKDVTKVFKSPDDHYILKVLKLIKPKFKLLHKEIQDELSDELG